MRRSGLAHDFPTFVDRALSATPSQNFRLEYWDEFNQDLKRPFLDMPDESDWVLYGINVRPGLDAQRHLLLARRQIGQFSARTRFVEVFRKVDADRSLHNNDYFGLYLAIEVPKQARIRVDIAKLELENTNAPAITGGYMFKIDRSGALRVFSAAHPLQAPQTYSPLHSGGD